MADDEIRIHKVKPQVADTGKKASKAQDGNNSDSADVDIWGNKSLAESSSASATPSEQSTSETSLFGPRIDAPNSDGTVFGNSTKQDNIDFSFSAQHDDYLPTFTQYRKVMNEISRKSTIKNLKAQYKKLLAENEKNYKIAQKEYESRKRGTADSLEKTASYDTEIRRYNSNSAYIELIKVIIDNSDKLNDIELQEVFKSTTLSETDEKRIEIANFYSQKVTHNADELQQAIDTGVKGKRNTNEQAMQQLQEVINSEGFISYLTNGLIFVVGGTTRGDVSDAIGKENTKIQELVKCAENKDVRTFMQKYKELTGVDFSVEKIQYLQEAEHQYMLAVIANNYKTATNELFVEMNNETRFKGTLSDYLNGNYNISSYETSYRKPGEKIIPSPLEKALLVANNNDKEKVVEWIKQKTYELDLYKLNKADKYQALVREFINSSHNCNLDSLETSFRSVDERVIPSPLEKALLKVYNGNAEMCVNWIRDNSKGLENKSKTERYMALVEKFRNYANYYSLIILKNKSLKSCEYDYKQALTAAYGSNIPQEKLQAYIEYQATSKEILQTAVMLGVGMLSGGSAIFAALATGGMGLIEKTTDGDGIQMSSNEINQLLFETGMTYASFKLFSAVASKVTPETYFYLTEQLNIPQQTAMTMAKYLGTGVGGFASSAASSVVVGAMQGKDISTILKDAVKSGLYGGVIAVGMAGVMDGLGSIKNKISEVQYEKMTPQEKVAHDYKNLLKSLKRNQKSDAKCEQLLQDIKGNEYSAESVNKVLKFLKDSLDGVYFASRDMKKPVIDSPKGGVNSPDTTSIIDTRVIDEYTIQRAFDYKYDNPELKNGVRLSFAEKDVLSALFKFRNSAKGLLKAYTTPQSEPFVNPNAGAPVQDPLLSYQPLNSSDAQAVMKGFDSAFPSFKVAAFMPKVEIVKIQQTKLSDDVSQNSEPDKTSTSSIKGQLKQSTVATAEDLKAVQKIDKENFAGHYEIEDTVAEYTQHLNDEQITTRVFKDSDGKVIGYYQLEPVQDGELYIYSIGVPKDLRNTRDSYRVLKSMQEEITNFAKDNGIKKVALDVDAGNQMLVKLYKKFGFEITDESSGVEDGNPYHDYHMEIDVAKALGKDTIEPKAVNAKVSEPEPAKAQDEIPAKEQETPTKPQVKTISKEEFIERIQSYNKTLHYDVYLNECLNPDGKTVNEDILQIIERQFAQNVFSEESTKNLVIAFKQNLELVKECLDKGIEFPRLIVEAMQINPDMTRKLLDAGEKDSFNIKSIAESSKINPELVQQCFDLGINSRFDIKDIVEAAGKNPELVQQCFSLGINDGYDIKNIVDAAQINSEIVQQCFEYSITSGSEIRVIAEAAQVNQKLVQQCFSLDIKYSYDIKNIVEAAGKNPELVQQCFKLDIKNAGDIENIVEAAEKNPELVQKCFSSGINAGYDIKDIVETAQKSPEFVMKCFELGIKTPSEIKTIAKIAKKSPEFTQKCLDLGMRNVGAIEKISWSASVKPEFVQKCFDLGITDASYINKLVSCAICSPKLAEKCLELGIRNENAIEGFSQAAQKIPELVEKCLDAGVVRSIYDLNTLVYAANRDYENLLRTFDKGTDRGHYTRIYFKWLEEGKFTANAIPNMLLDEITMGDYGNLVKKMGKESVAKLSIGDLHIACNAIELYKVNDLSELSVEAKKSLLKNFISINDDSLETSDEIRKDFPLIPEKSDSFIKELVSSLAKEDKSYRNLNEALESLLENASILQQADMAKLTEKEVTSLLLSPGRFETAMSLIDMDCTDVLKRAVELKYNGYLEFMENSQFLNHLKPETKKLLTEGLRTLKSPEQKLEKLQILAGVVKGMSAMLGKVLKSTGTYDTSKVADLAETIKSPKVTAEQQALADKIFTSDKSYAEQIEDFIREFNVPAKNQAIIRDYLKKARLNERLLTPPSIEKQVEVMKIKIKAIENNTKIPVDKKTRYLAQLNSQMQDIIDNPEKYNKPRINENAFKPLAEQIEAHINVPNNQAEFNSQVYRTIYEALNITPTPELLENVHFDSKYLARLFAPAHSRTALLISQLMDLLKQNPNKPLSEIFDQVIENQETHKLFTENGLDYEKWIKFDKDFVQPFTVKVDVKEAVTKAYDNLSVELMSELAKKLNPEEVAKLGKIIARFNQDNPTAKELTRIIDAIEQEMQSNEYWKSNDADVQTFKDHIKIHKKNIKATEKLKDTEEQLSVRLWDNDDIGRNIFFGNHVGCCTSIGAFNDFAAPQHLMNSFVNGIEIVDRGGNSMGNSMCYFAKVDGKLTFIIDSFEANGKLGASKEVTDALIDYAQKVCARMGRPDANIMFGPNYNKINLDRCIETDNHTIEVIGRAPSETYIDCVGGRGDINEPVKGRSMYEIPDLPEYPKPEPTKLKIAKETQSENSDLQTAAFMPRFQFPQMSQTALEVLDGSYELRNPATDEFIDYIPKGAKVLFDTSGKVIMSEEVIDGKKVVRNYSYNDKNALTDITKRDANGEIIKRVKIFAEEGKVNIPQYGRINMFPDSVAEYDKDGKITHVETLNGRTQIDIKYDNAGKIASIRHEDSNGTLSFMKPDKSGKLVDVNKLHKEFFKKHQDDLFDMMWGFDWAEFTGGKTKNHIAWKMHLYSVEETDWQKMSEIVIPYLKEQKVNFKTMHGAKCPELLSPKQQGKAFTIYPDSPEQMEEIAKGLDKLIRENNLTLSDTSIKGDRKMGDSGRLFYRYEFYSGKDKDKVIDVSTTKGEREYNSLYINNRGEDKYLASDMTAADDIWLTFNPADKNSHYVGNPNANVHNIENIENPQTVGEVAQKALSGSKYRIATAGYSAPPSGYEDATKAFLKALDTQLTDGKSSYITSPIADKGSIDAITTEIAGFEEGRLFYTTAKDYVEYINPDNFPETIDKASYEKVPKYVLPDATSYSQATAEASNAFIATGGRNATVSDFVNAIKKGNKAIILDNTSLDVPAWGEKKARVENASKYLKEQIQAVKDGKPLPYPEVGEFTEQFIKDNLPKLESLVRVCTTDGSEASTAEAAKKASEFLKGKTFEKVISKLNNSTEVSNTIAKDLIKFASQIKAIKSGVPEEYMPAYNNMRKNGISDLPATDIILRTAQKCKNLPDSVKSIAKELLMAKLDKYTFDIILESRFIDFEVLLPKLKEKYEFDKLTNDNMLGIIRKIKEEIKAENSEKLKTISPKKKEIFEQLKKLENRNYTIDDIITDVVNSDEEHLSVFADIAKTRFVSREDSKLLMKLNNEQIQQAKRLSHLEYINDENQLDVFEIYKFAKLEKSKFEDALKLLNMKSRQNNPPSSIGISMILEMLGKADKTTRDKIMYLADLPERGEHQYSFADISQLLQLTDDKFEVAKQRKLFNYNPELEKLHLVAPDILVLASMNDKQFTQFNSLLAQNETNKFDFETLSSLSRAKHPDMILDLMRKYPNKTFPKETVFKRFGTPKPYTIPEICQNLSDIQISYVEEVINNPDLTIYSSGYDGLGIRNNNGIELNIKGDKDTTVFNIGIKQGDKLIAKQLVKDKAGLYYSEDVMDNNEATQTDKRALQSILSYKVKLNTAPESYDIAHIIEFLSRANLQGDRVFFTDAPMDVGHAEFNLPQGTSTLGKSGDTTVTQLDATARPNKNSERITYHYSDGRTTVNDWELGVSSVLEPSENGNGMTLRKFVGNEEIRLTSEIKDGIIILKNNKTNHTIFYSLYDILEAKKLTAGLFSDAKAISDEERMARVEELFKKLSPTAILHILKFKKANPQAQFPYIADAIDSFCSANISTIIANGDSGQITLSDIPQIVAHEALHAMTFMRKLDNNKTLLDLHSKEIKDDTGLLRTLSEYAIDGNNDSQQIGLHELISIMGTFDEYGVELGSRAEAVRLAFPETAKAIEAEMVKSDLDLIDELIECKDSKYETFETSENQTAGLLPTVERSLSSTQSNWTQKDIDNALSSLKKFAKNIPADNPEPLFSQEEMLEIAQNETLFKRVSSLEKYIKIYTQRAEIPGESLFTGKQMLEFAKDEALYKKALIIKQIISDYGYATRETIASALSSNIKTLSRINKLCELSFEEKYGFGKSHLSYDAASKIASNDDLYNSFEKMLAMQKGEIEYSGREGYLLKNISKLGVNSVVELLQLDAETYSRAMELNGKKLGNIDQCIEIAKDKDMFDRAIKLSKFPELSKLSFYYLLDILKNEKGIERLYKLYNLAKAEDETYIPSSTYEVKNLADDVFNRIIEFSGIKTPDGKSKYGISCAIDLANVKDDAERAEIIKLMDEVGLEDGKNTLMVYSCQNLLETRKTNPELFEKEMQLLNIKNCYEHRYYSCSDIEWIAENPIYMERALKLPTLLGHSYNVDEIIKSDEIFGRVVKLSELNYKYNNNPIGSDWRGLYTDEATFNLAMKYLKDFVDENGNLLIGESSLKKILKYNEKRERVAALLKLKNYAGKPIIDDYSMDDFEFNSPENFEKIKFLIDKGVLISNSFALKTILEPEKWDSFKSLLDTTLPNGSKINPTLAALMARKNINVEAIEPLLSAKNKTGENLFTEIQIAKILNAYSFNDFDTNIYQYVVDTVLAHPDKIDDICNNIDKILTYGFDTVEKTSKYSFLKDDTFLSGYLVILAQNNPQARAKMVACANNPSKAMMCAQELLKEYLDFDLVDELDKSTCSDKIKQYLFMMSSKVSAEKITSLMHSLEEFIADKSIPDAKKIAEACIQNSQLDNVKYKMDYARKHSDKPSKVLVEELTSPNFNVKYYLSHLSQEATAKVNETFNNQQEKCLTHPELYVNGEYNSKAESIAVVKEFFDKHEHELKVMGDLIGADALDDLLRYRFDDAEEYLEMLTANENSMITFMSLDSGTFSYEEMRLLKAMTNSKKPDGSSFISIERVEMIDTLFGCKTMSSSVEEIQNMVANNALDIPKLHNDLLDTIFMNSGLNPAEIPQERRNAWNLKYMHMLAKELTGNEDGNVFADLFKVANLGDLRTYMEDTSNRYGAANAKTKELFSELGLNYDAWVHPDESCNISFKTQDAAHDKLQQISTQIIEDIEMLRATPAKARIDKTFGKYIKEGKFFIPTNIEGNKERLTNFVKNLHTQLNMLWKRAEGNKNNQNPDVAQRAQNTLTIKSHLEQRMSDIQAVQKSKVKKALQWKIKMWDRNPQKDIFQGNYSTCCIGMGQGNGHAMPHYIMNTSFQMIEISDELTGRVVGNALCYYAKDEQGKPVLVIDNIEINNHAKPSEDVGLNLRNAIGEFARNINGQVTGDKNTPIILGTNFNDVPIGSLAAKTADFSLLGDIDCDEIYMDLFSGWVNKTTNKKVGYFDLSKSLPPIPKAETKLDVTLKSKDVGVRSVATAINAQEAQIKADKLPVIPQTAGSTMPQIDGNGMFTKLITELSPQEQAIMLGEVNADNMSEKELEAVMGKVYTKLCDRLGIPNNVRSKIKAHGIAKQKSAQDLEQWFDDHKMNLVLNLVFLQLKKAELYNEFSFQGAFDKGDDPVKMSDEEIVDKLCRKIAKESDVLLEEVKENQELINRIKRVLNLPAMDNSVGGNYSAADNTVNINIQCPDLLNYLVHETYHQYTTYMMRRLPKAQVEKIVKEQVLSMAKNIKSDYIAVTSDDVMDMPEQLPAKLPEWIDKNLFNNPERFTQFQKYISDVLKYDYEMKEYKDYLDLHTEDAHALYELIENLDNEESCLEAYSEYQELLEVIEDLYENNDIISDKDSKYVHDKTKEIVVKCKASGIYTPEQITQMEDCVESINAGLVCWDRTEYNEKIDDAGKTLQKSREPISGFLAEIESLAKSPLSKVRNDVSAEKRLMAALFGEEVAPKKLNGKDLAKYIYALESKFYIVMGNYGRNNTELEPLNEKDKLRAINLTKRKVETLDGNMKSDKVFSEYYRSKEEISARQFGMRANLNAIKEYAANLAENSPKRQYFERLIKLKTKALENENELVTLYRQLVVKDLSKEEKRIIDKKINKCKKERFKLKDAIEKLSQTGEEIDVDTENIETKPEKSPMEELISDFEELITDDMAADGLSGKDLNPNDNSVTEISEQQLANLNQKFLSEMKKLGISEANMNGLSQMLQEIKIDDIHLAEYIYEIGLDKDIPMIIKNYDLWAGKDKYNSKEKFIEFLKDFPNIPEKYQKLLLENSDLFYKFMKIKFPINDSGAWDLLANNHVDFLELESNADEILDVINQYKFGSDGFAKASSESDNFLAEVDFKEYLTIINKFLDKQSIPSQITTYRGESSSSVQRQLFGEKTLWEILQAHENAPQAELDKLVETELSKNPISQTYPMSTSLNQNVAQGFNGNVLWKLTLPKGTKAACIDVYADGLNEEAEVLVASNAKRKITHIEFDKTTGKWIIEATIENGK